MKKWIIPLVILVLASCGGNYAPGSLQVSDDLDPPIQEGVSQNYWKMDENTELFYIVEGKGEPVLVLHGGPGMPYASPWPNLGDNGDFQYVYFHQRGCGKSTIPFESFESKNFGKNIQSLESELGLSENLKDIERIRRLLGVEKLKIIGHSFGGYLAVLYAIEFPLNIDSLVLVEPADMLKFPQSHGGLSAVEKWLTETQLEEYKSFMKEYFNYKDFFKKSESELAKMNLGFGDFYLAAMKNHNPEYVLPQEENIVKNGGFAGHAMFFSTPRKYDFRPYLKQLDVPVMIIRGANDLFSSKVSEEYHSLIPQSVYTVFESSSHFPYLEEPERFVWEVEHFFNH